MNNTIRVGLLIDSFEMPAWIVEMIKKISAIRNVQIAVIIVNEDPLSTNSSQKARYPTIWSYRFYTKLDQLLYKVVPKASDIFDLRPFVIDIPQLHIGTLNYGQKKQLKPADINNIGRFKPDVLIKLGFENLSGDILDLPRLGMWSMDCYKERPDPFIPGTVQFFNNIGVTPSAVTQLSNDPARERILYQSFTMTDEKSLNRSLNKIYWKSVSFIPRLLTMLAQFGEGGFWDLVDNITNSKKVYANATVNNRKIVKTFFDKTLTECKNRISALVNIRRWNLYFTAGGDNRIEIDPNVFKKVPGPKDAFWADPNAVRVDNKTFIFFEEWDYKKNKGHISAIEFNDNSNPPVVLKVLDRPYHLSYPFTFQSNGTWYMIPETAANHTIELYRCLNFPGEWEFVMNLMENIHAVDTTLYFYNNLWWLFANMVENAGASALDELFIFYAKDFLTTQWTAHKMNPVISDSRNARPAGALFSIGNRIFRPSQCSDKIYGRCTNINEIIVLTAENFSEVNVAALAPDGSDGSVGIHSYSKAGSLTFIDKFYSSNNRG